MPNRLKMTKVQAVMALHQRGWSQGRIARELGIHRRRLAGSWRQNRPFRTPARLLTAVACQLQNRPFRTPGLWKQTKFQNQPFRTPAQKMAPRPAISHTGEVATLGDAAASVPAGQSCELRGSAAKHASGRLSECAPFREWIEAAVERGLSAQRIWQDLKAEHAFSCSYYSVLRFVQKLAPRRELPFRRLECGPGDEAQVDFGTGAPFKNDEGKRQRTYVFRSSSVIAARLTARPSPGNRLRQRLVLSQPAKMT